ncbi:type II toxin-antitoxin system VapC family toxin [soil metagenome]
MLYLDASLVVASLILESHTPRVLAWIDEQDADDLWISAWTSTEVSSALSLKVRTGQIDVVDKRRALATYTDMVADSFKVLMITDRHFQTASGFVDRHTSGLRAGDGLHLAIAFSYGATVCTLDRMMADIGADLGVETNLI